MFTSEILLHNVTEDVNSVFNESPPAEIEPNMNLEDEPALMEHTSGVEMDSISTFDENSPAILIEPDFDEIVLARMTDDEAASIVNRLLTVTFPTYSREEKLFESVSSSAVIPGTSTVEEISATIFIADEEEMGDSDVSFDENPSFR